MVVMEHVCGGCLKKGGKERGKKDMRNKTTVDRHEVDIIVLRGIVMTKDIIFFFF